MTVDLADDDPRAARIRAVLFVQADDEPVTTLWNACSNEHREVLVALANGGEVVQPDLERKLGLNGVELRGRHSGIAKIAKRVGVDYPIHAVGTYRAARRFSLATDVSKQVLKLATKSAKKRRKP